MNDLHGNVLTRPFSNVPTNLGANQRQYVTVVRLRTGNDLITSEELCRNPGAKWTMFDSLEVKLF